MERRARTLSALAVTTAVVMGLAVITSFTLILLTTNFRRTIVTLGTSLESVRVAEEAHVDLLLHAGASDATVKQSLEGDLRRTLIQARRHVISSQEARVLDEAESAVEAFIAASREGLSPSRMAERQHAANAALGALVKINVEHSRVAHERAEHWDHLANVIGITTCVLLLLIAGSLLWWLKIRAFRPVHALAHTMERFGRGDRGARAEEAGPSELRDVAQRFNEMATSIGSRYDAQNAFFGGVAHDLRNPLSVLKMSLSMLRPGQVPPPEPELQRIFEIIDRQIMRLEIMAGDFLDIAKIEAGQLQLRREPQDVRGLISNTCSLFQGASPEHHIEVSAPDDPVVLRCDAFRIEQVLSNLISNAIKYSPGGGTVWVALTRTADEATIAVTDQGIGISAEDQQQLFKPFRRVGPSKGLIPGVGLGLFVTRTIVEGHGGRVEIESRSEKGSTFLVYLPLDLEPGGGGEVIPP